MKTSHYTLLISHIILLLLLFDSCEEAKLPPMESAQLKINVEWTDFSFHFSAEVSKSDNITIEEQGFVFTYPKYYSDDYWSSNETKSETFVISKNMPFEYAVKEEWPSQMQCRIYAYIKTNYGNFRSEEQNIFTGAQETPIITSILHVPDEENKQLWTSPGGTVYIEGRGFSKTLYRNKIWVSDGENTMTLYPEEASPSKIKARYYSGGWPKIGKCPIFLQVGNVDCPSQMSFEISGTTLVSTEPSSFYYGDEITLHLKNFQATDNFQLQMLSSEGWNDQFKIVSMAENKIRLRIYPHKTQDVKIRLYDKNHRYGPDLPISINNPWVVINHLEMPYIDAHCIYKGKGYIYSVSEKSLICYNPVTNQWSSYQFEIPSIASLDRVFLLGMNNYIYMLVRMQPLWVQEEWTTRYRQLFYRFNLATYHWEQLKNNDLDDLQFMNVNYIAWDQKTAYLHNDDDCFLRIYHSETDSWEKSSQSSIYKNINMIGRYGEYIYFSKNPWTEENNKIYRFKSGNIEHFELVFDGKDLLWNNIQDPVMHKNYIYFQNVYGVFRVNLSAPISTLESLAGPLENGMIIPSDRGIFFYDKTAIYKYSK